MKKISLLLLTGLALLAPVPSFAAAFEGKVTMKMSNPQAKEKDKELPSMNLSLKEGFYRMDMEVKGKNAGNNKDGSMKDDTMNVATIMDLQKLEMYVLMPQQKMYMVHKITQPEGDKNKVEQPTAKSDMSVERTGKTETILGYKCEQYLIKNKDLVTEIWATDQLGTYMGTSAGGGMGRKSNAAASQAWEEAFKGKDFFPLRVSTQDKKGQEAFRMEATSIQKMKLDASLFAPPAGYEKFDVGGMMKGMIPGFGK